VTSGARQASEDYDFWLATDAKVAQRIRDLITDIQRDPFRGIGKPEPLKHPLGRSWSRRITREHRLVYRVEGKGAHHRAVPVSLLMILAPCSRF
jgi:toxin YoeB